MNEIEQLASRVSKLSPNDFARFRACFRALEAERADRADSAADKLVDESLADYGRAGVAGEAPRAETLAGALRRAAAARP